MDETLAEEVRERAGHRCEYCLMPHALYPTVTFPLDHIISQQHRGPTVASNLALSCLHDNSHKGANIAGIDPNTGKLAPLFNADFRVRKINRCPLAVCDKTFVAAVSGTRCVGHVCQHSKTTERGRKFQLG